MYFGRGNKIPPIDDTLFFVYLSFFLGEEYLYFCLINVNVNAAGLWTVCSCFIHVLFWKIKLWRRLTGVSQSKHNFIFEFWFLEEKLGMVHITITMCHIAKNIGSCQIKFPTPDTLPNKLEDDTLPKRWIFHCNYTQVEIRTIKVQKVFLLHLRASKNESLLDLTKAVWKPLGSNFD